MVGIVILNYNTWLMSKNCIISIRNTTSIPYKIFLVDNASSKEMPEEIEKLLDSKDIVFIKNDVNKGYSAGNNVGIKAALEEGCNEILITNNDVIFEIDTIEELQKFLKNHREVGIVGPRIHLSNGDLQEFNMACEMTLAGKYKYLMRRTIFSPFVKRFVDDFHAEGKDKNSDIEVYAVSGCCFMFSEECVKQMYPLDENTFLFEEENILGNRMKQAGYKTFYHGGAMVYHIHSASTSECSEFAYMCFVKSEKYYCKRYLKANLLQILPLYMIRMFIYIKRYGIRDLNLYIKKTFYLV